MITIIDYGLGNILAFKNVYRRLNIAVSVAGSAEELKGASNLILPGVGSFDHAMELLNSSGMRESLDSMVLEERVPVMGICVGMQILAKGSEEGDLPGLGWIDGEVKKFDISTLPDQTHLPHMGWNDVHPVSPSPLFDCLEKDARFYFLHSYYFHCFHRNNVLAEAEYGNKFSCSVQAKNIYGVQFHPEKSHHYGTRLLKNFAEL